ncbi:hypothetical protein [Burkholderia gladioli]|uniref:hypothetical protein n=1 Tax=Burkholderia gladioli TaxID=28095 RepID=UPI00164052E8|nr:hypothetical protein [Burkholderia gladioli]
MIQALVDRTAKFRSAAFYALLPVSGISFATGRNSVALVSVSVAAALVVLDAFKWQRHVIR